MPYRFLSLAEDCQAKWPLSRRWTDSGVPEKQSEMTAKLQDAKCNGSAVTLVRSWPVSLDRHPDRIFRSVKRSVLLVVPSFTYSRLNVVTCHFSAERAPHCSVYCATLLARLEAALLNPFLTAMPFFNGFFSLSRIRRASWLYWFSGTRSCAFEDRRNASSKRLRGTMLSERNRGICCSQ